MSINLFLVGSAVIILYRMLKTRHFIKLLIMSSIQGIVALFAVNAIGVISGITIAINNITLLISCIAGVPGVIFLLLVRFATGL